MSSDGDIYQEVMPFDKLTEKQERFVQEYMIDFDKARAFFAAGYQAASKDIAVTRVLKMLKLPLIQAAIRQKQKEYALECRRYAPIDVMLANLDYWFTKAQQRAAPSIDEDGSTVDDGAKDAEMARRMAQEVARDAAPYIHPRLQAIAVASVGRKSIDEYTDDELAAIAAVAPEPADGSSGDGTSENQSKDAGTQQPA